MITSVRHDGHDRLHDRSKLAITSSGPQGSTVRFSSMARRSNGSTTSAAACTGPWGLTRNGHSVLLQYSKEPSKMDRRISAAVGLFQTSSTEDRETLPIGLLSQVGQQTKVSPSASPVPLETSNQLKGLEQNNFRSSFM